MKKLLCLLLAFAMLLVSAAAFAEAQPEQSLFTPGSYTAEAQGIFVPVKVTVRVSENEIETVLVDATGERPNWAGLPQKRWPWPSLTRRRRTWIL